MEWNGNKDRNDFENLPSFKMPASWRIVTKIRDNPAFWGVVEWEIEIYRVKSIRQASEHPC